MCVSVKGGSRKRQTKSDGVLSNEHTVELRSRIQKLVGMWADEVSKLLFTVKSCSHDMYVITASSIIFHSDFCIVGTNEWQ